MFELAIQSSFTAAHALLLNGVREEAHTHNWQLQVEVMGAELDGDGLLVDFHELERLVGDVIAPFQNVDLNQTPPFDEQNPSAEQVAGFIGRALEALLEPHPLVQLQAIRITEAPGCIATYRPD